MGSWIRCRSDPMTHINTYKHATKTSNTTELTTLDTTWVAPSEYGIRRGSDCPLGAPCLNPGSWWCPTRCLCQTRRGHWPDHVPSSCNPRWWHLSSAAGCGGSQSHAEKPASGCSTPPSCLGGAPSLSWGIFVCPIGLDLREIEHLPAMLWLTPPGRPSLHGSVATRAGWKTPSTVT
jgi:hypothetical protein